eukprot:1111590-Prymnesium_polylepis.1
MVPRLPAATMAAADTDGSSFQSSNAARALSAATSTMRAARTQNQDRALTGHTPLEALGLRAASP